jgi:Domain of unknown function (DUF4145)
LIPIFDKVNGTHPKLTQEIFRAFKLFWFDEVACADSIRQCGEIIVSLHEIARMDFEKWKAIEKRGSLHRRIEEDFTEDVERRKLLHGLRELGNYGSHPTESMIEDSHNLDGFKILRRLLDNRSVGHLQDDSDLLDRAKRLGHLPEGVLADS